MTTSNAKMFSRLDVMSNSTPPYQPQEYIAFTEPVQERELPTDLNKKIVASFCQPLTFCNTLSFLLRTGRCMRLAA